MKFSIRLPWILLFAIISAGCASPATAVLPLTTPTIRPPRPTATKTWVPTNPPNPTTNEISLPSDLPSCVDPSTAEFGRIIEIIDGDTIVAEINGSPRKIRYIGIDTPEMDSPGEVAQQAKDANTALAYGEQAWFFSDMGDTDMYDRLLRYVFIGDVFINQALVERGLAEEQEYAPNTACADYLRQAESIAKAASVGIWMKAVADPSAGLPRITALDKRAEVAVITNQGAAAVDLTGWVLMSERGNQACALAGSLPAGASIKVYAQKGTDGFSCNFTDMIWNNSETDPAALYNAAGELFDRWYDLR